MERQGQVPSIFHLPKEMSGVRFGPAVFVMPGRGAVCDPAAYQECP